MKTTQTIQIQLLGLHRCGDLETVIQQSLDAFRRMLPISSARVVLERQRDAAPACRIFAHLAVPGPDIHAAARDYTLAAAWRKLAANLRRQFQRRAERQQLRLKGRAQCRPVGSQWGRNT